MASIDRSNSGLSKMKEKYDESMASETDNNDGDESMAELIQTNLAHNMYLLLNAIKSTNNPYFIDACRNTCQELLTTDNIAATQQPQGNKRKLDETLTYTLATTNPKQEENSRHCKKPKLETEQVEEKGKEKETDQEKGKEKEKQQISKPGRKPVPEGGIIRSIISPDLIQWINALKLVSLDSLKAEQSRALAKNEQYNNQLSMKDISAIGRRSKHHSEIKERLPQNVKNKFIFSHHFTFPFTIRKQDDSLSRSTLYKDRDRRRDYIRTNVIANLDKNPTLAVQNVIYLYQHHLLNSVYMRRNSGDQLADLITYHLAKLGFQLEKREAKFKSAIISSYSLIIRSAPFNKLSPPRPNMRRIATEIEDTPVDLDNTKFTSIRLYQNPNKPVTRNDVFDEPFSNSLKIESDTNFYDDKGKLIGIYRVGIIKPKMISSQLRKELSSITQTKLNRQGAKSAEERQLKGADKKRNIKSAPFGVLGAPMSRLRPTQFSEEKPLVEDGLAPIIAVAENIYAQFAPKEYRQRCQAMGSAASFTLPGSAYLTAAEANFDKETRVHTDENCFPVAGLNPLFVIYPSSANQAREIQKNYKGGYTFFPGVCGYTSNDAQSYFEGVYIDLQEGDLMLWDFDRYYHCNTKLEPLEPTAVIPPWHRISVVMFTKGEVLRKIMEPIIFEDTDDEDSACFEEQVNWDSARLNELEGGDEEALCIPDEVLDSGRANDIIELAPFRPLTTTRLAFFGHSNSPLQQTDLPSIPELLTRNQME